MRYKQLSLLLLFTILLAPAANARKYYDAVDEYLKGHVRTYVVKKDDGRIYRKYEYNSEGKLIDDSSYGEPTFYTYNNQGYPIISHHSGRGDISLTYDSNHRIIKGFRLFFYNANGNLIREEEIPSKYYDNKIVVTYTINATDEHGNPTDFTTESFNVDKNTGKIISKRKMVYHYTAEYTYWDDPVTKPSSGQSKPQSEKQAGKPKPTTKPAAPQQTRGELSILDFFDYPCGDRQLSWSMTFTEARKALGSSAKKCEEPARYFDNNDSQGKIYLEGKSPIDFGLTDYKAYMLSGNIDYRGRSLNTLKYNRASAQIVFYKNSETYSPGQDMREYSRSHSRLTAPGEAAYDYLIEKIKASGAQIRKWKYDSHERVKSCKAVYKGRVFLLMLNKDYVYGNYYIEISTAAYYTENS